MIQRLDTLRREDGLGIIELVIAIAIMNVAIFAMFAMFQAGGLSILRASRTSNAAVLGEKQMELYRAMLYNDIRLNSTLVASADAVHINGPPVPPEWGSVANQVTDTSTPTCSSTLPECVPVQALVTGSDNRTYRIDTYITANTPAGGRAGKQVTVYVRLASDLSRVLAKLTSNFDRATGCIEGSTSNPC